MTAQPKIAITALRREYLDPTGRPILALDHLDLTIAEGEFVCLLGPSGCGKSTLLRLLANLEPPTVGTVTIDHHDPDRPAQAMVFQGPSLFPWRTVLDNVAYGLELGARPGTLARPEREALARQRIAQVGLARFADAYPHQLSEGMRQRANLARALAVDPAVILMDEPFGNLDEQNRLLMQQELLALWHHGNPAPSPRDHLTSAGRPAPAPASNPSPRRSLEHLWTTGPGGRNWWGTSWPQPLAGGFNPRIAASTDQRRPPPAARPVTIVFVTHSIDEAIVLADRIVILTPRPGRVDTILPVPLPRPRDAVALRGDPTYAALYAACWNRLREGVLTAHDAELSTP